MAATAAPQARIRLSQKQAEVWRILEGDPRVTEVLFGGAAGPGKTFLGCLWQISRRLLYPGTRGLIGRSRLSNLKLSTLNTFFNVWTEYAQHNAQGVRMKYNASSHVATFHFPGGQTSEIIFKDLFHYPSDPDFASLGSLEITDAFVDEATEVTEKAINILSSRIRYKLETLAVQRPKLLMCCNPANNWVKWRYVMTKEGKPVEMKAKARYVSSTLADNPNKVFRSIYGDALAELPNYDQRRLLHGDWTATDKTGFEFYHAFSLADHTGIYPRRPELPIHLTFDQNVNPYITCLAWQVEYHGDTLHLFQIDELCLEHPKNTTAALCTAVRERYPENQGIFFYGDASGNRRDTRSTETDYTIVERELRPMLTSGSNRTERHNPPVGMRRDFINELFQNKHGIKIHIDEGCTTSIDDLLGVKQDANGHKLKAKAVNPITGGTFETVGHTSDAMDYFLIGLNSKLFDKYRRR